MCIRDRPWAPVHAHGPPPPPLSPSLRWHAQCSACRWCDRRCTKRDGVAARMRPPRSGPGQPSSPHSAGSCRRDAAPPFSHSVAHVPTLCRQLQSRRRTPVLTLGSPCVHTLPAAAEETLRHGSRRHACLACMCSMHQPVRLRHGRGVAGLV
eukprot:364912-Chlamydomonas_euryale.AAC.19